MPVSGDDAIGACCERKTGDGDVFGVSAYVCREFLGLNENRVVPKEGDDSVCYLPRNFHFLGKGCVNLSKEMLRHNDIVAVEAELEYGLAQSP